MQICRELAGFSYGQADLVRRAMSKKKHDVMEKERQHFVYGNQTPGQECRGCVANGIPQAVANTIFDDMSSFASYAFNKSHAAAYAYVAYQTAYLKCHYHGPFMAALFTSVLDNTDKVIEYSGECQRLGIKLLAPDINISGGGFTVDGGNIRFGLNAVKNVGRGLIAAVVEARAGRPFASLYDFCKRMHGQELNRRALESLVKAGAFDSLGGTRRAMLQSIEGILKSVETDSRRNLEGQLDLFGQAEGGGGDYQLPSVEEYPTGELLRMEKEVSGLYLSGHPLDAYAEFIKNISSCKISELTGETAKDYDTKVVSIVCAVIKTKLMTTRSNTLMAFTNVEDLSGTMEILIFPKVLERCREALRENAVVVITGRVSVREEESAKLVANEVTPIENYRAGPGQNGAGQKGAAQTRAQVRELWLKLPSQQGREFEKVKNLLSIFEGSLPVCIYFEDTRQRVRAPRSLWTLDHPLLYSELERLLGPGHVATK